MPHFRVKAKQIYHYRPRNESCRPNEKSKLWACQIAVKLRAGLVLRMSSSRTGSIKPWCPLTCMRSGLWYPRRVTPNLQVIWRSSWRLPVSPHKEAYTPLLIDLASRLSVSQRQYPTTHTLSSRLWRQRRLAWTSFRLWSCGICSRGLVVHRQLGTSWIGCP